MEQLIPKLRFPEFSGEWEKKRLGDIADKIGSGKTPSGGSKVYTSRGIPFIRSQNVNDNRLILDETYISEVVHKSMKSSKVLENDILLNITGGSIGRSCVVPSYVKEANVNQHVCIIRLNKNNPHFIQKMISSNIGQKMIYQSQTGSGREGLNFDSISKFKITIPSLPEQQKIADYLSTIDKKLELLREKREQLECYKKGMMQQLFSQQIRFKDDSGKNYPDWQEKRLGEVSHKKASNLNQSKVGLGMKYQVYGASGKIGTLDTYQETKKYLAIIKDGAGIGKVFLCKPFTSVLGTLDKIYNSEISDIVFLYRLMQTINFNKYATGSTIPHIYYSDYSKIKINLPSLPEQQKIAEFLSALDTKIEGIANQIEQTEAFKKAMLQQLFV